MPQQTAMSTPTAKTRRAPRESAAGQPNDHYQTNPSSRSGAAGDPDAVHARLSRLADRLSELGETSEEKITLLLDGLEAAENVRRSLGTSVQTATGLLEQVDETAQACEKRLIDSTRRCEGEIRSQAETQLAHARGEIEKLIAPFRHDGDQLRQLTEIARRSADTIQQAAQRGTFQITEETRKSATQLQTTTGELARSIEERLAPFGPDGDRTARLAEITDRGLAKINDATERGSARIEENAQDRLEKILSTVAGLRKKIEEQVAPYEPSGEREKQLAEMTEGQIDRLRQAADQQTREIEKAVTQHLVQFDEAGDAKGRQLASQLQAANQSVRSVSEATREAHAVLNTLVQNRQATDAQLNALKNEARSAETVVAKIGDQLAGAQPTIESIRDAVKMSVGTIEKIESLTRDVWSLTSTTEERARVLGERDAQSRETVEQLTEAVRTVEARATEWTQRGDEIESRARTLDDAVAQAAKSRETLRTTVEDATRSGESLKAQVTDTVAAEARILKQTEAIEEKTDAARKLQKQQDEAYRRGEELIRRLEMIDTDASCAAERVTAAVNRAEEVQESLVKHADRAAEVGGHVEAALDNARTAGDRIVSQTLAAEQMTSKQRALGAEQAGLAQELCKIIESGAHVSKEISQATCVSAKAKEELLAGVQEAEAATTESAQLLAAVVERRESLESADEVLTEYVERASALQVKLQQLQTRADSFTHQINGMLTEPRKIVDEAKVQAGRLDGVCRSVRKVFGGLSQTSLQANRDISRFNEISREANDKLGELTNETNRAARTLHEWIDEAVHAQSRLAKTLTQVPSVAETHPTDSLSRLARTSTRVLSDVLKPFSPKQIPAESEVEKQATPKRGELAALIREAEQVAETSAS